MCMNDNYNSQGHGHEWIPRRCNLVKGRSPNLLPKGKTWNSVVQSVMVVLNIKVHTTCSKKEYPLRAPDMIKVILSCLQAPFIVIIRTYANIITPTLTMIKTSTKHDKLISATYGECIWFEVVTSLIKKNWLRIWGIRVKTNRTYQWYYEELRVSLSLDQYAL